MQIFTIALQDNGGEPLGQHEAETRREAVDEWARDVRENNGVDSLEVTEQGEHFAVHIEGEHGPEDITVSALTLDELDGAQKMHLAMNGATAE